MKNYAIVLGVPEYDNMSAVPGCGRNAQFIYSLLKATGKYQILYLPEDGKKNEIMKKITAFLPAAGGDAGEILLYYSGHGHQDTDMYFSLKSTNVCNLNGTALRNSEIDDVIRKADPVLFVKLLDSCHSGLHAGMATAGKGLPKSKGFQNCIFMSSSKKDQFSYCNQYYGMFTKALAEGIRRCPSSTVRYTDIQLHLTQAFLNDPRGQTPYFVFQGDGTEVFCIKTPGVAACLENFGVTARQKPPQQPPAQAADLQKFREHCKKKAAGSPYTREYQTQKMMGSLIDAMRLYDEGKFTEAIRHYRSTLERLPDEADLWLDLGKAYAASGDILAAREACCIALSLKSGDVEIVAYLGMLEYFWENAGEAYKHFRYVVSRLEDCDPGDRGDYLCFMAVVCRKLGKTAESAACLKRARDLGFSDVDTYFKKLTEG